MSPVKQKKKSSSTAQDSLIKVRTRQALNANKHRRAAIDPMMPSGPQAGDAPDRPVALRPQPIKFWVTTQNWPTVPFCSRKWTPKFVGPFDVLDFDPNTSTYTLDLPARYTKRRIRNVFHSSQLVPFTPTNEATFPNWVTSAVPVFPLDSLEMATIYVFEHKWARPIGSPAKRQTGKYDANGVEIMEDVDPTILTLVMGEVGRRAEARALCTPTGTYKLTCLRCRTIWPVLRSPTPYSYLRRGSQSLSFTKFRCTARPLTTPPIVTSQLPHRRPASRGARAAHHESARRTASAKYEDEMSSLRRELELEQLRSSIRSLRHRNPTCPAFPTQAREQSPPPPPARHVDRYAGSSAGSLSDRYRGLGVHERDEEEFEDERYRRTRLENEERGRTPTYR